MYEYRALKPITVILIRREKKRENNGGEESNQDIYMPM
jgi:hypothetical protein